MTISPELPVVITDYPVSNPLVVTISGVKSQPLSLTVYGSVGSGAIQQQNIWGANDNSDLLGSGAWMLVKAPYVQDDQIIFSIANNHSGGTFAKVVLLDVDGKETIF